MGGLGEGNKERAGRLGNQGRKRFLLRNKTGRSNF